MENPVAKQGLTKPKRDLWVSLTRDDGNPVWVNAALVRLIEPSIEGNSRVSFGPDHNIIVKGEPDMIARTLCLGK